MVKLLQEREEFLVIGLTGRVGSGCTEAANIFGSNIKQMQLPSISPGDRGLQDDDERDKRVLCQYFNAHWLAFDVIKVGAIITTFFLNDMKGFEKDLLHLEGNVVEDIHIENELGELKKSIQDRLCSKTVQLFSKDIFASADKMLFDEEEIKVENFTEEHLENEHVNSKSKSEKSEDVEERISYREILKKLDVFCEKCINIQDDEIISSEGGLRLNDVIADAEKLFRWIYQDNFPRIPYWKRRQYCENMSGILHILSSAMAEIQFRVWNIQKVDIWKELSEANSRLDKHKREEMNFKCFMFVHDFMPAIFSVIHDRLTKNGSENFTELFQKYGNCIRRFGEVIYDQNVIDCRLKFTQKSDIFAIPRKINQFIKVLRHPFGRVFNCPTRVVIDSLKNPFEATYLRERYTAFYLFAISSDEAIRIKRLTEAPQKRLDLGQIYHIDCNEYPSIGANIFEKYNREKGLRLEERTLLDDAWSFAEKVSNESDERGVLSDHVRKQAYLDRTYQFILQDVESCIQNADIFISNKGVAGKSNQLLKWEIIRNICLILYPGLVQPTLIERCMQIAFSAKANSGCLSRQVGAVVTDAQFNILSIGWNDVPCGDISCARKNLFDLCKEQDSGAYTAYELKNPDFRQRLEKKNIDNIEIDNYLCGLPLRYCFKDIHMKGKNPMRSRAMHAEEKALAMCGKESEGGVLFTTSSPCEMCSKNAKNHKIKFIYYIEPYAGISEDQYSRSGSSNNIAQHILFTGAIGRAYTQMYTPIMPHKDILECLGIDDILKLQPEINESFE